MFKIENLNLVYDIGKEVQTYALRNIDLDIVQKGMIGVIGPSGSGKSSLLYILAGLKKATSGNVSYRNKEYKELSQKDFDNIRLKEFGFIFQRNFLIDYMTVMENILTPINSNKDQDKVRALELLEGLKISHLAKKRPYQLSGGQRQKVAIARALINEPKVIFADELTAALDHENAKEVMSFLSKYKEKALIVVVTHDPSILEEADSIINIRDGIIVSIDSLKDVVK